VICLKVLKKIIDYREIIALLIFIVVCISKGIYIQLIIYGTISVAICLFLLRWLVSGKGILSTLGIGPYRKYAEIKKEFEKRTAESGNRKEQENSASGFSTEIEILKKMILNSEKFCMQRGYTPAETDNFIDARCKKFFEIVLPIVSASPNLYKVLVNMRPSLMAYLKELIEEHIRNRPDEFTIEVELVNLRKDVNFFSPSSDRKIDINKFVCVQILVDKYGFSQELLHVIQKVDPDMMKYVFELYDSRLNSLIPVDDCIR
jgi:hypothetical protein